MGIYADLPAPRLAYESDGTLVKCHSNSGFGTGNTTNFTQAQLKILNAEFGSFIGSGDTPPWGYSYGSGWVFVFPAPTTILGHAVAMFYNGAVTPYAQYSTDTVTGLDGTWTSTPYPHVGLTGDGHRAFKSCNLVGIKGIRYAASRDNGQNSILGTVALYGTRTVSGLLSWHATLDQQIDANYFNLGDLYRDHSVAIKQFRVKNTDAMTANDIVVSLDANSILSPALTSYASLSLDGVSYSSSVNIGTLTSGQISSVVYIKYAPTSTLGYGPYVFKIKSTATSWS